MRSRKLFLIACCLSLIIVAGEANARTPRLICTTRHFEKLCSAVWQIGGKLPGQKLEPGKPIEMELKGGESHSYEITLQAGQKLTARTASRA